MTDRKDRGRDMSIVRKGDLREKKRDLRKEIREGRFGMSKEFRIKSK